MTGRVVKGIGGFYYVFDGENIYMGKARGNLKRNKDLIYVGDVVDFEIDDNSECIINSVLRRDNFLIRPPASNLEMLVLVFAAADPEVNFPVVDKLLAACEAKNIDTAICITKGDLVSEDKLNGYMNVYRAIYPTVAVNGQTGDGIDDLVEVISGKSVALAGPSGVGKSSITNMILGYETAATGSISDKTMRGRHTTRHVEIFPLEDGTFLYDTPGFTSLEMPSMDEHDIWKLLPEFRKLAGQCRYSDCMHINEPECAVKEALVEGEIPATRYESYLLMTEEVKKWHK